jgi:hypothetical protein
VKYELIIDESVLDRYAEYYFEQHPRAKKKPIDKPYHPSINQWMILKRPSMNALKQKWKNFIIWFVNDLGYQNKKLDNCVIECKTIFKQNRRHDVDNTVPKFILDGFVESGFIVDDDNKHIAKLSLECGVDKEHPRTEFIIYEK